MPTYKDTVSKKYGDVLFPALSIVENTLQSFSVSPAIDIALSGGIPEGSWVSFAGPPGCGKTSTALQVMAESQKPKYNIGGKTRPSFYFDVEHRLKPMNLYGIHGLNPDNIQIIRSSKERQLSAQDFLEIIKLVIRDPENFGGVAIIDSTSALCPHDDLFDEVNGQRRSVMPKIMADFCRQMAGNVRTSQFTVIMIQHLITNTSQYGAKWQVDGGEKVKYQADVQMFTKGKPERWGDDRHPTGQIIEWEVIKSSLGQSGLSCSSYLKYGYGLDETKEVCNIATELSVVEKAGSWYKAKVGDTDYKWHGEEALYQAVKDDNKLLDHLFTESKKILGIK